MYLQIIIFSHLDWVGTKTEKSQSFNQIVKEPDNLLFKKMQYMNSPTIWMEYTVKHKWIFFMIDLIRKV